MFCSQCGAQNNDGTSFCVACGAPMKKVTPPQGQQFTQIPTPPPQYEQQLPSGIVARIQSSFNVIALAGAILTFIGLFPNFMSAKVFGVSVGASLIDGADGKIVLVLVLSCLAFALFGKNIGSLICGVLDLIIILVDISSSKAAKLDAGAGFIILFIASLIVIVGSVVGMIYRKQGKKLPCKNDMILKK